MAFAVIKTGGKQYKVAANDVLKIEKLEAQTGDIVTFDQVLMVGDDSGTTVGAPLVAGASVAAEFLETKKQKTVIVFKKNRRHNYRRRNGHRQLLSSVRITEILTGGALPTIAARTRVASEPGAAAPVASPSEDAEVLGAASAVATLDSPAVEAEATETGKPARRTRKAAEPAAATPDTAAAAEDAASNAETKPARRSAAKKAAPEAEQE